MLLLLITQMFFLLQGNLIILSLEPLERRSAFYDLSYVL